MESLLQNWPAWGLCIIAQVLIITVMHFAARQRFLNYWCAAALGIIAWLFPLLITSLTLSLDPRPTLMLASSGSALFGGIVLETKARREEVRAIVFYVLLVLSIGLAPALLLVWIALVPPGPGWIAQVVVASAGIGACGAITVFLHYGDMIGGMEIYKKDGLTPGERQTIVDAMYIVDRKLRPHLGDVAARMKRASEALQAGMANVESIMAFLDLVLTMLNAAALGTTDEAYLQTLHNINKVDHGVRPQPQQTRVSNRAQ